MDDSEEKCVENNSLNCIHPLPYDPMLPPKGNHINEQDLSIAEKAISELDEDTELIPGGKLWNYLINLAKYDGTVSNYVTSVGSYSYR